VQDGDTTLREPTVPNVRWVLRQAVTVFRMRCRLGLDNKTVEFEATRFEVYSLLQHAFLLRHGNAAHIDQMFDFHRPNSPKLK
jgi:hypothetical protein